MRMRKVDRMPAWQREEMFKEQREEWRKSYNEYCRKLEEKDKKVIQNEK